MIKISIYLITNRKLVSEERYLQTLSEAAEFDQINIILREKDLSEQEYKKLYYRIKSMIPNKEIIINSKIEVFRAVKSREIQLSFNDFMKYKKCNEKIGVSVHSLEEAVMADKKGADYLLVSHIFETKCKAGLPPKGISFIKEVKENVQCKVIALGGINYDNYQKVISAGADGIAIMSLLFNSNDVKKDINRFI